MPNFELENPIYNQLAAIISKLTQEMNNKRETHLTAKGK